MFIYVLVGVTAFVFHPSCPFKEINHYSDQDDCQNDHNEGHHSDARVQVIGLFWSSLLGDPDRFLLIKCFGIDLLVHTIVCSRVLNAIVVFLFDGSSIGMLYKVRVSG